MKTIMVDIETNEWLVVPDPEVAGWYEDELSDWFYPYWEDEPDC